MPAATERGWRRVGMCRGRSPHRRCREEGGPGFAWCRNMERRGPDAAGARAPRHRGKSDCSGERFRRPIRSRKVRESAGYGRRRPGFPASGRCPRGEPATGPGRFGRPGSFRSPSAANRDGGLRLGRGRSARSSSRQSCWVVPLRAGQRYQSSRSPYCRSRRSRRSWASMQRVATGLASRRLTPMGSPVSRQ